MSGANPVPDNKLTASSSYFDFENGGYHGPSEGRLNSQRVEYANGSFDAGTWAADVPDTNPWIQVGIITNAFYLRAYVSSFKLMPF